MNDARCEKLQTGKLDRHQIWEPGKIYCHYLLDCNFLNFSFQISKHRRDRDSKCWTNRKRKHKFTLNFLSTLLPFIIQQATILHKFRLITFPNFQHINTILEGPRTLATLPSWTYLCWLGPFYICLQSTDVCWNEADRGNAPALKEKVRPTEPNGYRNPMKGGQTVFCQEDIYEISDKQEGPPIDSWRPV